jgi:hypothetical protein
MAAPGRTVRKQVPFGESQRRHRVYTRRKKAVMLIAGLLLLPIALLMIVRFDQGRLGDSFARLIGATPASGLVQVAQVTSTATPVTPEPTLFEPPRQTPLPTETATPAATLFEPPRQTPLPTETATPVPTLFEPPRQTPLPTLFEPPRQTPLPTGSATAAPDVVDVTATTEAPGSTDATATPDGEPPKVLPTTGLVTELPMQSIGFALLFVSLMLIAAALRRENDG